KLPTTLLRKIMWALGRVEHENDAPVAHPRPGYRSRSITGPTAVDRRRWFGRDRCNGRGIRPGRGSPRPAVLSRRPARSSTTQHVLNPPLRRYGRSGARAPSIYLVVDVVGRGHGTSSIAIQQPVNRHLPPYQPTYPSTSACPPGQPGLLLYTTKNLLGADEPPTMGMTAIEEESSLPRIEGGRGGGASTRAASGARRAPTAADEAPDPSYDANDDPTMTAVRWTNDVSSDDTDGATGPPALPMGTSTMAEGRGRLSRLAVDVGSISASRKRRVADESSNTTRARLFRPNDEDGR
ncbi:hypothetical protein THAOC_22666, partial [Thalassiosira oceanica]